MAVVPKLRPPPWPHLARELSRHFCLVWVPRQGPYQLCSPFYGPTWTGKQVSSPVQLLSIISRPASPEKSHHRCHEAAENILWQSSAGKLISRPTQIPSTTSSSIYQEHSLRPCLIMKLSPKPCTKSVQTAALSGHSLRPYLTTYSTN